MERLKTKITEVTVCANHAWVTRQGTLELEAGEHVLVVESLPPTLDVSSVRAAIEGGPDARIQGVEVLPQSALTPEPDAKALQKELERLQEDDQALADEDAAQMERLKFLKALRKSSTVELSRAMVNGQTGQESVTAFSEFLVRELNAAYATRREIAHKRRALEKLIKPLEDKLNTPTPEGGGLGSRFRPFGASRAANAPHSVRIAVLATEAASVQISVMYRVNQASWEPAYDVRLVGDHLVVNYLAQIKQNTGEDWPEAAMSFSTARPQQQPNLTQLAPWIVDELPPPSPPAPPAPPAPPRPSFFSRMDQEPPPSPFGSLPSDRRPQPEQPRPEPPQRPFGLFRERSKDAAAEANAEQVAELASLELSGTSPVVCYPVARPIAVPSDHQPRRAMIASFDLEAAIDYVTIPRQTEQVSLRVSATNTSGYVLLAGTASLFHGGDFVDKTPLRLTTAGEPLSLIMGADSRLLVHRELTERSSSTTVVGNIRRTTFAYRISVTNHLPAAAYVTVTDQLPVSRHEDIGVRVKEIAPKPVAQTEQNVLYWKLELGPDETQEITLSFTVDHPREMRITGIV